MRPMSIATASYPTAYVGCRIVVKRRRVGPGIEDVVEPDGRHVLGDAQARLPASASIAPRHDRSLLATTAVNRRGLEDGGHRGASTLEPMLAEADQPGSTRRPSPRVPAGRRVPARRCRRPGGACRRRTRCPRARLVEMPHGLTDPAGVVDDHARPGASGVVKTIGNPLAWRSSTYAAWAADRSSGTTMSPSASHGPTGTKSVSRAGTGHTVRRPAPSACVLTPRRAGGGSHGRAQPRGCPPSGRARAGRWSCPGRPARSR